MTRWQDRFKLVAAAYLIIEKNGKVLLLRRYQTGYEDGNYSLPAGHLEGDEPPTAAAIREAQEEVGLQLQPSDLELAHIMVYKAVEKDHERISLFFRVTTIDQEPTNNEPDKCDELRWVAMDELPDNMVYEVTHAFAHIAKGEIYSETGYIN